MGRGIIYGFNTLASNTIIKIGRTEQTLNQRLRGYIGPSKPRTLLFRKEVDDSVEAENWVKKLMSQCSSFTQRFDLGDEWYESIPGLKDEVRNEHMLNISEVARLAVRDVSQPDPPTHPSTAQAMLTAKIIDTKISTQNTSIPGMEGYFSDMDRFVDKEPKEAMMNAEGLTQAFESSAKCRFLCEYLPNSFEYRTSVVGNRYAHMFQ